VIPEKPHFRQACCTVVPDKPYYILSCSTMVTDKPPGRWTSCGGTWQASLQTGMLHSGVTSLTAKRHASQWYLTSLTADGHAAQWYLTTFTADRPPAQ